MDPIRKSYEKVIMQGCNFSDELREDMKMYQGIDFKKEIMNIAEHEYRARKLREQNNEL